MGKPRQTKASKKAAKKSEEKSTKEKSPKEKKSDVNKSPKKSPKKEEEEIEQDKSPKESPKKSPKSSSDEKPKLNPFAAMMGKSPAGPTSTSSSNKYEDIVKKSRYDPIEDAIWKKDQKTP